MWNVFYSMEYLCCENKFELRITLYGGVFNGQNLKKHFIYAKIAILILFLHKYCI